MRIIYLVIVFVIGFVPANANEPTSFEGPMLETTDLELIYSEQGIVTAQLQAAQRLVYENGDTIYPAGIYGILYDKDKNITMTLSANTAYQYMDKNIYELKGAVEIKSYQDKKQLNTEELYWDLTNKEVYTDKFVKIETKEDLLTGYGLVAKQDLSYYSILEPQGFANVESTTVQTKKDA